MSTSPASHYLEESYKIWVEVSFLLSLSLPGQEYPYPLTLQLLPRPSGKDLPRVFLTALDCHTQLLHLLYVSNVPCTQHAKQNSLALTPPSDLTIFQCSPCQSMTKTETKELTLILPSSISLSLNHHRVLSVSPSGFFSSSSVSLHFRCHLSKVRYNLITGMTSHHFCRVMLVKSKCQVLFTLKGKRL